MQEGQAKATDDDHSTFKDHECDLLVGKGAVKSTGQLDRTKDGSNEDAERSYTEAEEEGVEKAAVLEIRVAL